MAANTATALADRWLSRGDFLLAPLEGEFDFVVGNPPYVRQELIPAPLLAEYRSRYQTMYDRADIYIPFIERSLSVLSDDGSLSPICARIAVKNHYGGPLRSLVAECFHLKVYVDMVDTPPGFPFGRDCLPRNHHHQPQSTRERRCAFAHRRPLTGRRWLY
ncbi:MAG: Eco57I restriction-modification methylase domain-containing protein [Candidatus Competibacteraceae bacterium]